jgi:hypothetical protein
MVAAAILEIEERAIKWQLPPDFDANWYTDLEKHAEFKIHNTGSDNQVSRWSPPPYWKLKSVL